MGKENSVGMVLNVLNDSLKAIPAVSRIDHKEVMLSPSGEDPKSLAKRKSPAVACKAFKKIIVERLAKASVLTAYLWSTALPKADMSQQQSLQFFDFEATPDYVPPNY